MFLTSTMQFTTIQVKFWKYLQGDFLYRVHSGLRKAIQILIAVVMVAFLLASLYTLHEVVVLPTVTARKLGIFDYAG